ncbi:MAG: CRISPR-associated protein Cas4 [Bacteroidota bacterium]
MFTEDDFIQLSALQHYVFCPRQCALIHVEDVWNENVYTVRGNILHEKVDTDTYESRGTIKTVRGLRIHSYRLGLAGRTDVVEFRQSKSDPGELEVLPVEFKSGQPKNDLSDKVQLCAQALCLEEMLNTAVKGGAFFYGRIRRRIQVEFDGELRKQTEEIIAAVHDLVFRRHVPPARYMEKCRRCSLEDICQPKAMNERKLAEYVKGLYSL